MAAQHSPRSELNILGQRISIRASKTDPEMLKQIIQLVTDRVEAIAARSRGIPSHQVALLALLELAEEHLRLKSGATESLARLENLVAQFEMSEATPDVQAPSP